LPNGKHAPSPQKPRADLQSRQHALLPEAEKPPVVPRSLLLRQAFLCFFQWLRATPTPRERTRRGMASLLASFRSPPLIQRTTTRAHRRELSSWRTNYTL